MKRQVRKHLEGLFRCRPWFIWRKCVKCQQEFRREHGWAFVSNKRVYHLCEECGPTYREAGDFFGNEFRPPLEEGHTRKEDRHPQPDLKIMPQGPRKGKEIERDE